LNQDTIGLGRPAAGLEGGTDTLVRLTQAGPLERIPKVVEVERVHLVLAISGNDSRGRNTGQGAGEGLKVTVNGTGGGHLRGADKSSADSVDNIGGQARSGFTGGQLRTIADGLVPNVPGPETLGGLNVARTDQGVVASVVVTSIGLPDVVIHKVDSGREDTTPAAVVVLEILVVTSACGRGESSSVEAVLARGSLCTQGKCGDGDREQGGDLNHFEDSRRLKKKYEGGRREDWSERSSW